MKKIKITLEEAPKKGKYDKYPRLNMDVVAFGSPEDVEKLQIDYIKQVRKIVLRRCMIVIILIALCLFGIAIVGGYSVGAAASPNSHSTFTRTYVLNKNTKKFHSLYCKNVSDISPSNKKEVKWSREKIISRSYSPCGNCKP